MQWLEEKIRKEWTEMDHCSCCPCCGCSCSGKGYEEDFEPFRKRKIEEYINEIDKVFEEVVLKE